MVFDRRSASSSSAAASSKNGGHPPPNNRRPARLLLEDGTAFDGWSFGAGESVAGEVGERGHDGVSTNTLPFFVCGEVQTMEQSMLLLLVLLVLLLLLLLLERFSISFFLDRDIYPPNIIWGCRNFSNL